MYASSFHYCNCAVWGGSSNTYVYFVWFLNYTQISWLGRWIYFVMRCVNPCLKEILRITGFLAFAHHLVFEQCKQFWIPSVIHPLLELIRVNFWGKCLLFWLHSVTLYIIFTLIFADCSVTLIIRESHH